MNKQTFAVTAFSLLIGLLFCYTALIKSKTNQISIEEEILIDYSYPLQEQTDTSANAE